MTLTAALEPWLMPDSTRSILRSCKKWSNATFTQSTGVPEKEYISTSSVDSTCRRNSGVDMVMA